EANSTEAVFRRHSEAIAALKDAYGEAAAGIREFAKESKVVADALRVISTFSLGDVLQKEISGLVAGGELFTRDLSGVNAEIVRLQEEMLTAFDEATYTEIERRIASLYQAIADGTEGIVVAADRFKPF